MKCDELKADKTFVFGEECEAYKKSEADKVIADLEESHKKEVGQLLIEIAELKKEKELVIEQTAEVINGQERELRRHKHKRCMNNACTSFGSPLPRNSRRKTDAVDKSNA